MKNISSISTINLIRLISAGIAVVITVIFTTSSIWFYFRHSVELIEIVKDPYSLPIFIAILVLLYFLIIVVRAAHEPQYAMFLLGRLQEIIFLKKWTLAIAPLIVLVSLAIGYFIEQWKIPITLFGWVATLYAIYEFAKDISGAWLRPIERENFFLLETKKPQRIDQLLTEDESIKIPTGYKKITTWRGRILSIGDESYLLESFITNSRVNEALQTSHSSLFNRSLIIHENTKFRLNEELDKYREIALIQTRAKGGLLFNEKKIRLAVDLCRLIDNDVEPIVLQQTNYYLSLCSNELTKFKISSRDSSNKLGSDIFNYVRNKKTGVVVSLDDSELSNHIGGGVLAITPAGKVILSKQGRMSVVATGLLAPSGSGSFDWSDKKLSTDTLGALINYGLERELKEECNFLQKDIKRTIILGMGRDLSRGGKPEFLAVSLLKRVQPKVQKNEIGFIDQHEFIELSARSSESLKEQLTVWLHDNRGRCSPALIINLQLLLEANKNTYDAILEHIKS